MAKGIGDTSLRVVTVSEGEANQHELDVLRTYLGIPRELPLARMELAGRLYGPVWRDYSVILLGVTHRVEGFTPEYKPGWPYVALDNMPGPVPAALVIQAWGMRALHKTCPVLAEQTWHPDRGIDYRLWAAAPEDMTAANLKTARRGLDLLTMVNRRRGRPPGTYRVPDSAIVRAFRDFVQEHQARPTQEQLVNELQQCGHDIDVRTLQRRCDDHGGWEQWPMLVARKSR